MPTMKQPSIATQIPESVKVLLNICIHFKCIFI